jgi:hypothetical protein
MHDLYASWFNASGPLHDGVADAVADLKTVYLEDKKYAVKLNDVTAFLEDMEIFVIGAMDQIETEAMTPIIKNVAICSVEMMAKIANIVAERDSRNDAADFMPPVLPHQLVKIRGRGFADIIRLQTERLSNFWSPQDIELISSKIFKIFERRTTASRL